jgi:hypothetical protein
MKYDTVVALKAAFDPTFPDLRDVGKDEDRIPGRDLGELVAEGLKRHGLEAQGPSNEEPFFVVRCKSGRFDYGILCYIYEPAEDPVWVVECPRKLGFLAKLRGQSEESELGAVVSAMHDILRDDPRVKEMRWFRELPPVPWGEETKYDTSPMSAF